MLHYPSAFVCEDVNNDSLQALKETNQAIGVVAINITCEVIIETCSVSKDEMASLMHTVGMR